MFSITRLRKSDSTRRPTDFFTNYVSNHGFFVPSASIRTLNFEVLLLNTSSLLRFASKFHSTKLGRLIRRARHDAKAHCRDSIRR